ncbi:MAG: DNA mismatch repair protein MutS [Spirochaetaceae bacterium]|nr:DNA mismatch repair protein MutS [Spirochaetaceae bacterium]
MMAQYLSIKSKYPDTILFFRLGDFYEMFDEQAVEVSRLLNLTLTKRVSVPMCGIPFHASKIYIARLLRLGKKIAICEQIAVGTGRGLFERRVTEIITPGTTFEEDYLDRGSNNFLASLVPVKAGKETVYAFAWLDVSTAIFEACSWNKEEHAEEAPKNINRVAPCELLLPKSLENDPVVSGITASMPGTVVSYYQDWQFNAEIAYKKLVSQFKTVNLRSFSLTENSPEIIPAGFLLEYAAKNAGTDLTHISGISLYKETEYLNLDESSRKNLELTVNLRDGSSRFTLFEVINHTCTPMGSRLLRQRISSPLTDVKQIKHRQNEVQILAENSTCADNLRKILQETSDVERLASRVAMDRAHAKDLLALKKSLDCYVAMKKETARFNLFSNDTEQAENVSEIIGKAIKEDPSIYLTEGNMIARGWSEELDHLHDIQTNFSAILDKYLEEEKQRTGIPSLKIRYNRQSGYYIEVTKANLALVPQDYIRKRSFINGERFTTEKLEELENELLSSSEKIIELERKLFIDLRDKLKAFVQYFFVCAEEIAELDVTASNAWCAKHFHWVCPEVDDSSAFQIEQGRHPVVEFHLPEGSFVPNDVCLDEKPFALITGPNMAGKSTFLRQNALIAVLAQIGSYVPAEKAHIGVVDKIFCRVGASDNLARGESTFLVEMTETANILRSATAKSLVIMDEVGRGTSTEDGLSIAWAVSEFLLNTIKAKTLFATHYHELTRLTHESLQLLCLEVLETSGEVIFLKRIKEGASENSYGLHVARLAGIPQKVIDRAAKIIAVLQKHSPATETIISDGDSGIDFAGEKLNSTAAAATEIRANTNAPGLFSEEELVLEEILSLNIDELTPLEALKNLARWQKQLSGK